MKYVLICLFLFFAGLSGLNAAIFHSTMAGGWWNDPDTWQSTTYPQAEDDVYIHGIVYTAGPAECHDLHVVGADAVIKAADNAHGSITVYGDLTSTGWVSNSGSYNLTVNLYGNLSISYHFVPYAFNWLGAGNKVLSTYSESGYGLRARTTTIAEEVDAIYAATDICFTSNSYTPVITGGTAQATFRLWDPATLQPHRLVSSSCRLEKLTVQGMEGSEFNFNNSYSLSNVYMTDCNLADVTTTGIHALDTGCSLTNITNTGSIYNQASASRTVNQYGYLVNSGQIGQAPHGYQFTVYSYGNISNSGLFKPSYLYLKGPAARELQSTEANPIQASGAIYGEAGLGDIHPGDQLWFANIPAINGPISFKAYTLDRTSQPKTLHFANTLIQNASVSGMAGSAIHGTELRLDNTPLTDIATEGTISFSGTSNITRIVNNGVIQNGSSGSTTLNIWGDFVNYGTVTSSSGYQLSINAYDDVRNYGTWTNHDLNMQGDDAQDICFGPLHPFAGLYLYDLNVTAGIYVVEEDLYIQANTVDLNYSTLHLNPGGFGLHLSGATLQEAYISSDLGNIINMTNFARLSSVGLQSITNNGSLDLITSINLSGDLVNNGTVRNMGASVTFSVSGNLTNNGTVCNGGGYYLSVYIGGSAINNGTWSNYLTRMNGAADQLIHFPPEHPCTGAQFTDSVAGSVLFTNADLYFSGCNLDLNYAPLRLNDGRTGPFDVTFDNCQVNETVFQSDLGSTLNAQNGGSIVNCSFQSITFAGTIALVTTTSASGSIVNQGILQNSGNSITLNVGGNLTNNGTIRNFSGYSLTVNLAGNAVNNGSWNHYILRLNGSSAQTIQFPAGHAFGGAYFYDGNAGSPITVNGDNYFTTCQLDLDNAPLVLSGGHDLYLDNCIVFDAAIQSGLGTTFSMQNGGYINNCSFQSVTFAGTVSINSNTTVSGDLVNTGSIRNTGSSYRLYVQGDLTNQGSIYSSEGYLLYLHIYGDLLNPGSVNCYWIEFNGTADQHINTTGSMNSSYLVDTQAGSALILDTALTLTNSYVDLNSANLILNQGTRNGVTFSLSGGYLIEATVTGGNGAKLVLANNAYLGTLVLDEIIWEGTVLIGEGVSVGHLINSATVQNWGTSSQTLTVNQRLDNSAGGVLQNNVYNLYLSLYGDLYDYGQLRNYEINFRGSGDQNIFQSATADTIRCTYLKKTNASGRVVMLSDLVLKSCNVDLNNRDLVMVSGRTPHTLSLYGGYLQNLRLESAASAILYMANSAFLTGNITCGNMVWQGSVSIGTSVYIGDLVNQALISNRSGGSAYLYVNGNLDNHGTITNSDAYPMYLYLYGNLSDSGILSNRYTYLNGTGVQTIWQATSADAIRCVYLRKTVASGDVALLSDLRMVGCYLDLNGRSLDLGGGGMDHALAMSGGYITSTILSSPGNGVLNLSNGCYLNSVSGGNVTLQGAVIIRGTCYFGNVTNTAVTSNYASETSNLYVSGSLINSGSFQNDGWPLYLRISGHLTNNGVLANRRVYMTGSTNQNVFFNGTEILQYLTLNSDIGSAQWYHDGSYSGTTGSSIDLAMDNPLLYGSWQAYVPASNTWGRIVTVSPAGAITQPQNLTISLDPGGVKLSWDQVAGAVSYKIYASQNAVAGFTEIMGGIIDPDPGDGSVEQVLEASLQARFFRVTASN